MHARLPLRYVCCVLTIGSWQPIPSAQYICGHVARCSSIWRVSLAPSSVRERPRPQRGPVDKKINQANGPWSAAKKFIGTAPEVHRRLLSGSDKPAQFSPRCSSTWTVLVLVPTVNGRGYMTN
jgi:hypothetical protein